MAKITLPEMLGILAKEGCTEIHVFPHNDTPYKPSREAPSPANYTLLKKFAAEHPDMCFIAVQDGHGFFVFDTGNKEFVEWGGAEFLNLRVGFESVELTKLDKPRVRNTELFETEGTQNQFPASDTPLLSEPLALVRDRLSETSKIGYRGPFPIPVTSIINLVTKAMTYPRVQQAIKEIQNYIQNYIQSHLSKSIFCEGQLPSITDCYDEKDGHWWKRDNGTWVRVQDNSSGYSKKYFKLIMFLLYVQHYFFKSWYKDENSFFLIYMILYTATRQSLQLISGYKEAQPVLILITREIFSASMLPQLFSNINDFSTLITSIQGILELTEFGRVVPETVLENLENYKKTIQIFQFDQIANSSISIADGILKNIPSDILSGVLNIPENLKVIPWVLENVPGELKVIPEGSFEKTGIKATNVQ